MLSIVVTGIFNSTLWFFSEQRRVPTNILSFEMVFEDVME